MLIWWFLTSHLALWFFLRWARFLLLTLPWLLFLRFSILFPIHKYISQKPHALNTFDIIEEESNTVSGPFPPKLVPQYDIQSYFKGLLVAWPLYASFSLLQPSLFLSVILIREDKNWQMHTYDSDWTLSTMIGWTQGWMANFYPAKPHRFTKMRQRSCTSSYWVSYFVSLFPSSSLYIWVVVRTLPLLWVEQLQHCRTRFCQTSSSSNFAHIATQQRWCKRVKWVVVARKWGTKHDAWPLSRVSHFFQCLSVKTLSIK